MYNHIFKADYLLFNARCSVETVAFIEIALKFFEEKNLPCTRGDLFDEYKFKLKELLEYVFSKDSNNRFLSIKFLNDYINNSELVEKIEKMFSDKRFGMRGKTFDELITMHNSIPYISIDKEKHLFEILILGMELVFSSYPYNFRCYYSSIEGEPYFIIGSWKNI